MTLPVPSQTEKWGNICPPWVGHIQWWQTNVTKSILMSMWKVVWEKTKYSTFFMTKLEQWNAGPGEWKVSLHFGGEKIKRKKKSLFLCHVVSLQSSCRLLISQIRELSELQGCATESEKVRPRKAKHSLSDNSNLTSEGWGTTGRRVKL